MTVEFKIPITMFYLLSFSCSICIYTIFLNLLCTYFFNAFSSPCHFLRHALCHRPTSFHVESSLSLRTSLWSTWGSYIYPSMAIPFCYRSVGPLHPSVSHPPWSFRLDSFHVPDPDCHRVLSLPSYGKLGSPRMRWLGHGPSCRVTDLTGTRLPKSHSITTSSGFLLTPVWKSE